MVFSRSGFFMYIKHHNDYSGFTSQISPSELQYKSNALCFLSLMDNTSFLAPQYSFCPSAHWFLLPVPQFGYAGIERITRDQCCHLCPSSRMTILVLKTQLFSQRNWCVTFMWSFIQVVLQIYYWIWSFVLLCVCVPQQENLTQDNSAENTSIDLSSIDARV